jgi:hypothetical protein
MIEPEDSSGQGDYESMLADLNRRLEESLRARNAIPDPGMGGLSPTQVTRLIYLEWGQPGGAVQFHTGVPLEDLEGAAFFCVTRTFLLALHDAGGVRATTAKNLPRQFVADVLPRVCSEEELERIHRYNKVINEMDVAPLHYARVVAQAAGLVRLYNGKFGVPKAKTAMLREERASDLFRCLFIAFFRKFNLGYTHAARFEARALQTCAAYTLCRLGEVARDWHPVDDLPEELLLPAVRDEIEEEIHGSPYWTVEMLLTERLLYWFIRWGLLEGRDEQKTKYARELKAVRVAPLYGKLLRFELDA